MVVLSGAICTKTGKGEDSRIILFIISNMLSTVPTRPRKDNILLYLAICINRPTALIARQFVEMTRIRIEVCQLERPSVSIDFSLLHIACMFVPPGLVGSISKVVGLR